MKNNKNEKISISKKTERYILNYPQIKYCLDKGLINYSSLARKICNEINIKNFQAVLVSIQRLYRKRKELNNQKEIISLIKDSKIIVRTKIAIIIIEKPKNFEIINQISNYVKKQKENFNIIEGEETFTLITHIKFLDYLKNKLRYWLIKVNKNLIQISFIFDEKIENTYGVVAFIYGLLAERGINIIEEMSCWKDLFIIIEEKDLTKTLEIFSFK